MNHIAIHASLHYNLCLFTSLSAPIYLTNRYIFLTHCLSIGYKTHIYRIGQENSYKLFLQKLEWYQDRRKLTYECLSLIYRKTTFYNKFQKSTANNCIYHKL